eukprot:scaffold122303_cov40-Tisochrysis_lutea.AAC.1
MQKYLAPPTLSTVASHATDANTLAVSAACRLWAGAPGAPWTRVRPTPTCWRSQQRALCEPALRGLCPNDRPLPPWSAFERGFINERLVLQTRSFAWRLSARVSKHLARTLASPSSSSACA